MEAGILKVIRVRHEPRKDIFATEVRAELRVGASYVVGNELGLNNPGIIEQAERTMVGSILRSLYGDLEIRLEHLGRYAMMRAKEDADARVIQGMLGEIGELIGAKKQALMDRVVKVEDEGVGYPELYFNENRPGL